MAGKLKTDYLMRYFGKDGAIVEFAEGLIKAKEIEAALYLNAIINVMGQSVTLFSVRNDIDAKFPGLQVRVKGLDLYRQLKQYNSSYEATELVIFHGGLVKTRMFSQKITVRLNSHEYIFNNTEEYCQFVLNLYAEKYT